MGGKIQNSSGIPEIKFWTGELKTSRGFNKHNLTRIYKKEEYWVVSTRYIPFLKLKFNITERLTYLRLDPIYLLFPLIKLLY